MPNEMRKIVFTADELQAALVNYALRTNKKLPNATVENLLMLKTHCNSVNLQKSIQNLIIKHGQNSSSNKEQQYD